MCKGNILFIKFVPVFIVMIHLLIFLLFHASQSGRSPGGVSLDLLSDQGFTELHPPLPTHAHHVTVPGAAAGWIDMVEKFGSGKVNISHHIHHTKHTHNVPLCVVI